MISCNESDVNLEDIEISLDKRKIADHGESDENKKPGLNKAALRKSIISFAWPCVAELFLISLISMVSLIMVGHLGAYAITAVGITSQPVLISVAVFQAFNVGATALVARFIGARDYKNAKIVTIQTLVISLISGLFISVLGFVFSRPIVVFMGAQGDTVNYADMYMKYMSVGIFLQAMPTAVSSLLRGTGDTKSPMRYNIISNIINLIAGYLLIYGFLGIPSLGVEGAAISSTLAKIVAFVMSTYIIITSKLPISISLKDKFKLDINIIKRVMKIGYSAAGEQLAMRVGLLAFAKMVADLGTIYFAAYQVTISIVSLSFTFGQALGMVTTSYIGRNLGAKKPDIAEIYAKEIRRMGMAISLVMSVCFFFLGRRIAALYTTDTTVIFSVAILLKIVAAYLPAQSSQLIIAGGLRGAGDTRWPMIATISGVIGTRMILGFLFIKVFMWGLIGAWVAMSIDQLVRSFIIYLRFRTGKWKYLKV